MWAILFSAVNTLLGFVFRSLIVKFVTFFALYYIVTEFVSYISSKMPAASSLSSAFGGLNSGVWYFIDLCAFNVGFPAIVAAWVLRFAIRRIPVIG